MDYQRKMMADKENCALVLNDILSTIDDINYPKTLSPKRRKEAKKALVHLHVGMTKLCEIHKIKILRKDDGR